MTHADDPHDGLHITYDAHGIPAGVIDISAMGDTTTKLVFELVLASADVTAIQQILSRYRSETTADAFAILLYTALISMTSNVLEKVLTGCDIAGLQARQTVTKKAHAYLDQAP